MPKIEIDELNNKIQKVTRAMEILKNTVSAS